MPFVKPLSRNAWQTVMHEALMEMMPLCLSARGRGKIVIEELTTNPSYYRFLNRQVYLIQTLVRGVTSAEALEIITKRDAVNGFWLGDYGRFLESGTFDPSPKNIHCNAG